IGAKRAPRSRGALSPGIETVRRNGVTPQRPAGLARRATYCTSRSKRTGARGPLSRKNRLRRRRPWPRMGGATAAPTAMPPTLPTMIPITNGVTQTRELAIGALPPTSLNPNHRLRVLPERIQPVKRTLLGAENMDDQVAE